MNFQLKITAIVEHFKENNLKKKFINQKWENSLQKEVSTSIFVLHRCIRQQISVTFLLHKRTRRILWNWKKQKRQLQKLKNEYNVVYELRTYAKFKASRISTDDTNGNHNDYTTAYNLRLNTIRYNSPVNNLCTKSSQ